MREHSKTPKGLITAYTDTTPNPLSVTTTYTQILRSHIPAQVQFLSQNDPCDAPPCLLRTISYSSHRVSSVGPFPKLPSNETPSTLTRNSKSQHSKQNETPVHSNVSPILSDLSQNSSRRWNQTKKIKELDETVEKANETIDTLTDQKKKNEELINDMQWKLSILLKRDQIQMEPHTPGTTTATPIGVRADSLHLDSERDDTDNCIGMEMNTPGVAPSGRGKYPKVQWPTPKTSPNERKTHKNNNQVYYGT